MLQCMRLLVVLPLLVLASVNAQCAEPPTLKQLLKQERDESDKQFDEQQLSGLRSLVSRLPHSDAEPPIGRTVYVSFKDKEEWRTETYDAQRLPAEFESVLHVLGERFETRDRHESKSVSRTR